MDYNHIKSLIELAQNAEISELEVESDGCKVRIVLHNSAAIAVEAAKPVIQHTEIASPVPNVSLDNNISVNSPMVGTFYRASSPNSAPFVEVGQTVTKGQVLCIVEAMKLMNQIESTESGVIAEILVADGAPIEYGQPLFLLRK